MKQFEEAFKLFKDFRFTDRAITTCEKMIMLETREEVNFNCGQEMLESGSNLIVTTSDDGRQINCMVNPASRQAIVGD